MFGYWFAFPCECAGPPYVNIVRGNCFWKMTTKQAFSNSVWLSAQRMLGKLLLQGRRDINRECVFWPLSSRNHVTSKMWELQFYPEDLTSRDRVVCFLPVPCHVNTFLGHAGTSHEGADCGSVSGSAGFHAMVTQMRWLSTGYGSVARNC